MRAYSPDISSSSRDPIKERTHSFPSLQKEVIRALLKRDNFVVEWEAAKELGRLPRHAIDEHIENNCDWLAARGCDLMLIKLLAYAIRGAVDARGRRR